MKRKLASEAETALEEKMVFGNGGGKTKEREMEGDEEG